MNGRDESDWQKWWRFFGRRIREFLFLGMWVGMAWVLDVYIVSSFPVSGAPKYMMFAFEGLFDISTLIELIKLLFWPEHAQTSRWLR